MASALTRAATMPADEAYLTSIQDPFFKSVANQVIPPTASSGSLASASIRLDDLEIAVRKQLLHILMEQRQINSSDEEGAHAVGTFWRSALDLCHHLVHQSSQTEITDARFKDMNARRLPILLISDCLDGLPSLKASQRYWEEFVEPAFESVIFGDLFWNDAKTVCHLPLLKVCNQFLRALDRSVENTAEWKGRILWSLAKGFSLADKSSLKPWGTFHSSNETEFESQLEFEEQSTDTMVPSSTATLPKPLSIDYSLYEAFWSLQSNFSNPNHIQVGDFIKKLRMVLTALESAASIKSNTTTMLSDDVISTLSKKYLTSSALLPSQIANPTFRCSVVTQFLIVGWHLSAESPPLKNALASLLTRARKLLQRDDPQLYELVWNGILASGREDEWRQWKKQKCPAKPFEPKEKRPHTHEDGSPKVKKSRLMSGPLDGTEGKTMSTEDDYEFISMEDLKRISKEHMERVPKLTKHLENYAEALDPEAGIEEEYHPRNDSMYTWQAMRLYSKHQLSLLRNVRRPEDLERITRNWYQARGEEIPGDIPPESELFDTGSNDNKSDNQQSKEPVLDEDQEDDSQGDDQMETTDDHDKQDNDALSVGSQSQHSQSQGEAADEMEVERVVDPTEDADEVPPPEESDNEEVIDAATTIKEDQNGRGTEEANDKEGTKPDIKTTVHAGKEHSNDSTEKRIEKEEKGTETSEPPNKSKPQNNRGRGGKGKLSPRNPPAPRDSGKSNAPPRDGGGRRSSEGGQIRPGGGDDRRGRNEAPPVQSYGRDGRQEGRHKDDYHGDGRHSGDRYGGGPNRAGPPDRDRGGPPPGRGGPGRGGLRDGRGDGRRDGGDRRPNRRRR